MCMKVGMSRCLRHMIGGNLFDKPGLGPCVYSNLPGHDPLGVSRWCVCPRGFDRLGAHRPSARVWHRAYQLRAGASSTKPSAGPRRSRPVYLETPHGGRGSAPGRRVTHVVGLGQCDAI
jgi:hypothetical protein